MKLKLSTALLFIAFAGGLSGAASAQSTGLELTQTINKDDESGHFDVGVGALYTPVWVGTRESKFMPVAYLDYQTKSGLFLSTYRGIGIEQKLDQWSFSAALKAEFLDANYNSTNLFFVSKVPWLSNPDKRSVLVNLAASYQTDFGISLKATANLNATSRVNGNSYTLGWNMPLVQAQSDRVSFDQTVTIGDAKYNQTHFGINAGWDVFAGQKISYPGYYPGFGVNNLKSSVAWTHNFDQRWSIRTAASLTSLTSKAANSPVISRKNDVSVISTVNYAF